jgi:hypothetical protein
MIDRNTTVLKKSNRILELTVCLLPKYIEAQTPIFGIN